MGILFVRFSKMSQWRAVKEKNIIPTTMFESLEAEFGRAEAVPRPKAAWSSHCIIVDSLDALAIERADALTPAPVLQRTLLSSPLTNSEERQTRPTPV